MDMTIAEQTAHALRIANDAIQYMEPDEFRTDPQLVNATEEDLYAILSMIRDSNVVLPPPTDVERIISEVTEALYYGCDTSAYDQVSPGVFRLELHDPETYKPTGRRYNLTLTVTPITDNTKEF